MFRFAIVLTALFGCATAGAPHALTPQVQTGPGADATTKRVLALSASCGSVEFQCPSEYVAVVDDIVRTSMDFSGYTLVDASGLRIETRQRVETREKETTTTSSAGTSETTNTLGLDTTTASERASATTRTKSTTVLDGPGFNDLTVIDRQRVIAQAGADSVLTVRVIVGAQVGVWAPNQDVEVMVKLAVSGGDSMAWASRCVANSNNFSNVNAALENAARCAVFGGTGN